VGLNKIIAMYHDALKDFDVNGVNPIALDDIGRVKRVLKKILINSWFLPSVDMTSTLLKCATLFFPTQFIKDSLERYRETNSPNDYCREHLNRGNVFYFRFYRLMTGAVLQWQPRSLAPLSSSYKVARRKWDILLEEDHNNKYERLCDKNAFSVSVYEDFAKATLGCKPGLPLWTLQVAAIGCYTLGNTLVYSDPNEERVAIWAEYTTEMFKKKVPHELMLVPYLRFIEPMMHVYIACGVSREMMYCFKGVEGVKKYDEVCNRRKAVFDTLGVYLPPVLVEMVDLYMV